MTFDKSFVWGAATAAYQIEGAYKDDGKGLSIWDVFCTQEGRIFQGQTGNIACDHYHHYKEDVQLMREMGLKAYRFSISWPRVLPDGTGRINEKGLDFYDKLVNELIANGIEPYVTLYHWDYPYELQKKGGWLNPDSPKWFAEYTQVIVDRLSDRVKNWFTLNEPQCFIGLGHFDTRLAPGLKLSVKELLTAAHNTLLAHGMAVSVIRQRSKQKANIGFAPQGLVSFPATVCEADIQAAKQEMFSVKKERPVNNNVWWMDPVYKGEYPEEAWKLFEKEMPVIGPDDMKLISQPLDYFAINTYGGTPVFMNESGKPELLKRYDGYPENAREWPLDFDALYWGAKFFYERYKLPILMAENGIPTCDWVHLDGKVHDTNRIDFLQRNIMSLEKAAGEGVPMHGYFVWSLLDNMEWYTGYAKRFGLIYVDYPTSKRIIKDSGLWYKQFIQGLVV